MQAREQGIPQVDKVFLPDDGHWQIYRSLRQKQKIFGRLCLLLLLVALLTMIDGLQGLMRSGAQSFELLPGERLALSGPAGIKNPVASDLLATFTPDDGQCLFQFEDFFAGYWFGSGMWRGAVVAADDARAGEYKLSIRFRGTAASTTQNYTLRIYSDAQELRAASPSLAIRLTGQNPFILAACSAILGILAGIVIYRLGRAQMRELAYMGLGEVVRVAADEERRIWCLLYGARPPATGAVCPVLDANGDCLAHARVDRANKGTLELCALPALGAVPIKTGCLVVLRPQKTQP